MIRSIEKKDLELVEQLENACFQEVWSKDALKEELNHSYAYGWLLDEWAYVWIWELYENAEIVRIGVHPDKRKKGYGKQLMDYALNHARKQACQQISLEVRVSNQKAISLYEKCGLVISHRSKKHYSNGEDAYVMLGTL